MILWDSLSQSHFLFAMVRVVTLSGEEVLHTPDITGDQLTKEVAEALKVPWCKLISSSGAEVAKDAIITEEILTAVVVSLDPLLQMLGLEGPQSEEMERMALKFGASLLETACEHDRPGHLCGTLRVYWAWGSGEPFPCEPPPPCFRGKEYLELTEEQPLLPAGTRLTVTRAPETLGLVEETVTTLTSPMILEDLHKIPRQAKLEKEDIRELLKLPAAREMAADLVYRSIHVRSYEPGEVCLEVGHVFWRDDYSNYWDPKWSVELFDTWPVSELMANWRYLGTALAGNFLSFVQWATMGRKEKMLWF